MNPNDESGYAFPWSLDTLYKPDLGQRGMSLRDYFAGQAMAGSVHDTPIGAEHHVAAAAYRIADAMLAERAKPILPRKT